MVIWLVGMYASGKSTIAEEIRTILEKKDNKVLVLNGGDIRQILGGNLSFSIEDRKLNAERVSRICKYLSDQGIVVICAMLSIFEETRKWNRDNIDGYYEVFVDVSLNNLLLRDTKHMYRKALNGEVESFVGVDIEFVKPESPNIVIDNNQPRESLAELAQIVVNDIQLVKK
ncbi:adenylyl-sulfate kinase [Candidatus Puniceispirillum sp.]|nr:adenylyl-sulfate kinase [Candidatus Puniceispirillum sp.]